METGWAVFLEVTRLIHLDERVVCLLAIEGVGLQPLFTASDAIGSRSCDDAVTSGRHIIDDRLAGERRKRLAVGFILRTNRHYTGDALLRAIAVQNVVGNLH